MIRCILVFFTIFFPSIGFAQVGFYSPSGLSESFVSETDVALFNFSSTEHMKAQLKKAQNGKMKVYIELGETLNKRKTVDKLVQVHRDGTEKKFSPLPNHKLLTISSKEEVSKIFLLIGPILEKYKDTVEAIFIADEPYLNGISTDDLNRLASFVREELNKRNLKQVKTGVVFASAFINSDFAKLMNKRATDYALSIDNYYKSLTAKKNLSDNERFWLENIERIRLTTYDQANNIYTGGGIPDAVDIIGFNFYISTLLQDFLHNNSLIWFSNNTNIESCKQFSNLKITDIHSQLYMYSNSENFESYQSDRMMLDKLYACRMKATLSLINEQIAITERPEREVLIVSESSTNGAIQRQKDGSVSLKQNSALVDLRVADEVGRALAFYRTQKSVDNLLFFTYYDEVDYSLKLNIGGVEHNEIAKKIIFENTDRQY